MKSYLTALIILIAAVSCRQESPQSGPPPITLSEVRDLGRIEFAEMAISKMGTIDDLRLNDASTFNEKAAAIFNNLKIGSRKGAWSYDTYMRAYIDMSELEENDVILDTVNLTARISLPPIKIEMTERDIAMREEHYRVSGLRSNISAAERAALKEKMNEMLKKEVASNPEFSDNLKKEARASAEQWINSLFQSRGYTPTVTFK